MSYAFESMAAVIPEGASGDAEVTHFEVTKQDSDFTRLRAIVTGSRTEEVDAGKYVRLKVAGQLMMSDTQMEQDTNRDFLYNASRSGGDILVGGLGVGLILVPLLRMKNVSSVLVLEKSQGVVDLVLPSLQGHLGRLGKKLKVVTADILEWKPPKGVKWDCIYFDIWPNTCVDNLVEVSKLKRKFARRLNRDNPAAWMGAWREDYLRYLQRSGRWR